MNIKNLFILLFLILLTSSCKNIFEDTADINSKEAILYQARMYLTKGDWDNAILEYEKLDLQTLGEPEIAVDYASAYSGRCGLDFLTLADNIDNIGSTDVFQMILNNFTSDDIQNLVDCQEAERILKNIADATTGRVETLRGRYLMSFNSLAKMGVIVSYRGDVDNDKVIDAGWDPCSNLTGLVDLPNVEASEIVTAIALFLNNIEGLSVGSNLLASAEAACKGLSTYDPAYNFCSVINVDDVNGFHIIGARSVLVETTDGMGFDIRAGGIVANAAACNP